MWKQPQKQSPLNRGPVLVFAGVFRFVPMSFTRLWPDLADLRLRNAQGDDGRCHGELLCSRLTFQHSMHLHRFWQEPEPSRSHIRAFPSSSSFFILRWFCSCSERWRKPCRMCRLFCIDSNSNCSTCKNRAPSRAALRMRQERQKQKTKVFIPLWSRLSMAREHSSFT